MKKAKKQIIYVWDYLEWGGVQIYFFALMRFLSNEFDTKAILPEGSADKLLEYLKKDKLNFEFFESRKASLSTVGIFGKIKRRFENLKCNYKLARRLSKEDLQNSIIHIDSTPWANFLFLFYLASKTSVFITFHTTLPKLSKISESIWKAKFGILCKLRNFHLAVSNLEVKSSLKPYLSDAKFDEIKLAYSGINSDEIREISTNNVSRKEIASKYSFREEKFWLCNVGQFVDRKGCWFLLDALKTLKQQDIEIFCYWLGTSELDSEIKQRIVEYDLGDSFRFLSAKEIGETRADLLNLVKVADLFVMPSVEEGLPIGLVEAMALGKACIASNINAIPEAIIHKESGYLMPSKNSIAIVDAIVELKQNEILRNQLGENAKILAFLKFDDKAAGQIMFDYYNSVG